MTISYPFLLILVIIVAIMLFCCCNVSKTLAPIIEREQIKLIRATGLTSKEVVTYLLLIGEEEFRHRLAADVQKYFQSSKTTRVLDVFMKNSKTSSRKGTYYASCSIEPTDNQKYDMSLAYCFSLSFSKPQNDLFEQLHHHMGIE